MSEEIKNEQEIEEKVEEPKAAPKKKKKEVLALEEKVAGLESELAL